MDLPSIAKHLNSTDKLPRVYSKEVIHIRLDIDGKNIDIFIFSYGCVIFWGSNSAIEDKFLASIAQYAQKPFKAYVVDRCEYRVSPEEEISVDDENDEIILNSENPYIKLSFSYGLSQSVKLDVLENSIDQSIEVNKNLPTELIDTGKISLSRRTLAKKIGLLFMKKSMVSLNTEVLGTPHFFWKRPKYEPYYEMALQFLDIKPRLEILTKRLDVMHELYEILSAELHHVHSARLEWIIIFLILVEVLLVTFKDILGWL